MKFKKEIANENKRKDFDECKYLYADIKNLEFFSQLKVPKLKEVKYEKFFAFGFGRDF
jgi:hypothetical protein